ncbi:MAG: nucleotide exchange factor GrpE [Bacteroidales bacterium]|jgi:molecular chaperone GrpE|nr:nucleotide exchange factor GrpE [Bacteroidales bacterium]
MSKKKSSFREDTKHNQKGEESENKKDNTNTESIDQAEEANSATADPGEQPVSVAEEEALTADKVVSAEELLEEKLAEMQDKYIRLSAEFDNYRKRTLREKMDLTKFASENVLLKILPFMDDFERALANMENARDHNAVKEGIDLIHIKFLDFLKQNGISEVEALDIPFNIDLHDAVGKMPVEDKNRKGKVVEVIQKGYYLLDKVIRHSKVIVGE